MTGWLVHIDNYTLRHADHAAGAVRARGLRTAAIGPADEVAGLADVERAIALDRCDAASVAGALREIERDGRIAAIRCMFGLPEAERSLAAICAEERRARGLAGPGAAALDMCNVKALARMRLDRAGVESVRHAIVGSGEEAAGFARALGRPVILKPLTGVAAGFVRRCADPEAARRGFGAIVERLGGAAHRPTRSPAFTAFSAMGDIGIDPRSSLLAEEWIDGLEISVECLVIGRTPLPLVVNDKLMLEETDWTVREPLLVSPPTRLAPDQTRAAKAHAARIIAALGLSDCVCHVEMRVTPDRGPLLLEINPRIGAGCVRDSLETFWNIDPIGVDIDLALGRAPRISAFERTDRGHAMIFLFSEGRGRLRAIEGVEALMRRPGVLCVRQMTAIGEPVDGRHEEQFILGVWRRLADGESPRSAYRDTVERVRIDVG